MSTHSASLRTTARFFVKRERALAAVFKPTDLETIWQKTVWSQIRQMEISDLHDYYDFNRQRAARAQEISTSILLGSYRASPPVIFTIEKKLGITRHMMLPGPSDALVFQAIVESLRFQIEKAKPTTRAYYSRDKHSLRLPHQTVDKYELLTWTVLWRRFQTQIFKFSRAHKYLVVTDLSNFFDSIGLRELRHVISEGVKAPEVILDLLFNLIEQLSWAPDYLPSSLRGLPTINLEAPRLLAHALLYEIDEILDNRTKGSFVRWMDDINFGVDTRESGCTTLGTINDVLKSRGLALNLSKTTILTAKEVRTHFLYIENRELDAVLKTIDSGKAIGKRRAKCVRDLRRLYRSVVVREDLRNWDKVIKRIFNLSGRVSSPFLLEDIENYYLTKPGLRRAVELYLIRIGPTVRCREVVSKLLLSNQLYDDISLFQLCRIVTNWELRRSASTQAFLDPILTFLAKRTDTIGIFSAFWLHAKYASPENLMSLVFAKKPTWKTDPFLMRQVAGITPRLLASSKFAGKAKTLLEEQIQTGTRDSASVALNVLSLATTTVLDGALKKYIFSDKIQKPYPLPKYLVLLATMTSPGWKKDVKSRALLSTYLTDPWFKFWTSGLT